MNTHSRTRALTAVTRFATDNYFHTLMILFAAIVFTFFTTKEYIPALFRIAMPWVLLIMITSTEKRRWFWMLAVSSVMLLINVYLNFYVIANHGFVIAYIGLALMIVVAAENGELLMQKIALWFLTLLMGLALIQKLSSPYYMSGNLIGDYILSGNMFKVLISLFYPDWFNVVHENLAGRRELADTMPQTGNSLSLAVPAGITILIMGLTYTSLAAQFLMEAALLLRARLGIWVHYALLLFVVIIYSTRNENVFLSMNCILGYALTDEQTKSARKFYVLWIFYLLAMELSGVRPGILA